MSPESWSGFSGGQHRYLQYEMERATGQQQRAGRTWSQDGWRSWWVGGNIQRGFSLARAKGNPRSRRCRCHRLADGADRSGCSAERTAGNPGRLPAIGVVLADTEDIWSSEFRRAGQQYRAPDLVIYKGQHPTGCGTGDARMGPFYCPADQKIYIDLGFYDQLERQFDAPGDFAQAYVVAHEVGHHVQNLLGISAKVSAMRGRPDYNQYSVRLELQADFLAGLWANQNQHYLESGDIEEAMRAANQIGDDTIQARTQGEIVPHAFTHGTSEQRMRWFNKGFQSGKLEDSDTFDMPYDDL